MAVEGIIGGQSPPVTQIVRGLVREDETIRPMARRLYRFVMCRPVAQRLGGKLGLSSDSDGPYVLLVGIRAVLVNAATMAFASLHPFPRAGETGG